MDNQIFLWVNSWAGKSIWLDTAGIVLAVYGIYALAVWALAGIIWYRKNFYLALVSVFISRILIVETIKIWVNRPRPFEVLPVHLLLTDTGHGEAFSSGHAVVMVAIAFSFYKTKWFWPMFVLAALSSIARVFVGVHYPFDIIASFFIAWATVWLLNRLFKNRFLS